jgi:hypothetical protein
MLEKVSTLRKFPDFESSKGVVKFSDHRTGEGINDSHPPLRSTVKKGASVQGVEHKFFPISEVS